MNDIYSFYQLISKYQIEIPIIQRDYAQGRDNAKAADVRNALVKKMINAVEKEDETLFFDFVYGRVDGNKFIPFDGQQRLTTLFLFHKYVFEKCQSKSNCGHKDNCICNGILGRFSYATRQSSREFCDKLVQENIVPSGDRKISENIINQSWFYPDWQKDPTVMGMLTMLDEIHSQMKDKNDFKTFAEKLTSGCNCPITFHFVDMGEHKLSDETYVKMNARGKQLTPFENFKASLEQYLEEKSKLKELTEEQQEKYKKLLDRLNGKYDIDLQKYTGIDGTWLDLFWNVANEGKKETELPDSLMMSFFNRHFMNVWRCRYATISKTDELDKFNDRIQKEMPLFPTKDDFVSFDIYSYVMDNCGVEKCLTPIFNICDDLYNDKEKDIVNVFSQAVWNRSGDSNGEKWDLFQKNVNNETYKSRAAFYALLKYYEKKQENQEPPKNQKTELAQWMRIVWNIIENYVEREESYIPALQLIETIAENGFDITTLRVYNGVAKDQVNEEIAKVMKIHAGSRSDGKSWEEIIIDAEKYAFFKGSIRFLFTKKEIGDDWDGFDTKWENAQKCFDGNNVDEDSYFSNLRKFINQCSTNTELKNIIYDILPASWKINLLNGDLANVTHRFLSDDSNTIQNNEDAVWQKVKEDLTNTDLLKNLSYNGSHVNGCRLRDDKYGQIALFPSGANSDQKKYVIGNIRNTILSTLLKNKKVTCGQKISNCDFFWGWNINFEYTKDDKSFAFQWNTDGNVYLTENNNRKKKDDGSVYYFKADGIDDSAKFTKALDDLIKDA